jgi:hypothetical protein
VAAEVADRRVVATGLFIADPLWRFSDAPMHYDCFQAWPLRQAFVDKYNATAGPRVRGSGARNVMRDDGTIDTARAIGQLGPGRSRRGAGSRTVGSARPKPTPS